MDRRRRRKESIRTAASWWVNNIQLLLDSFDRSNRVLDYAESGQPPIVNGTTTVASIVSNKMILTVAGDGNGSVGWEVDAQNVLLTVVVGALAAGADVKIFVRGTANDANMIYVAFKQGVNTVVIHNVVAGVDTILVSGTWGDGLFVAGAIVLFIVNEDHILVANGSNEASLRATSPLVLAQQGTRVGVFASLTTSWDYVQATVAPPTSIMDSQY